VLLGGVRNWLLQARCLAARPGFRPCVEILEDRLAPAAPMPYDPTVESITSLSALLGGTIDAAHNGGLGIQVRGVVYSTTAKTDADLQIGKPNVTEVDAPANLADGPFVVTIGPLTPNTTYYFRAFATNGTLPANNDFATGYTSIVNFKTNPGSAQENRIIMPSSTVNPSDPAAVNSVLFIQPTAGQTWLRPDDKTTFTIPRIPDKQITFTNNLTTTVYPFMRDAAATIDPMASGQKVPGPRYQGEYDPIDQINEEYRGYIGYQLNGVNYLGLLPGMSITIDVPLVFWDGARCEIATDGTYLVNDLKVNSGEPLAPVPNPFQYYAFNKTGKTDADRTARVALPAVSIGDAPAGVTKGMVMWYREGINAQTPPPLKVKPPEQALAPVGDAPSQLIEWTIRDPVLSTLNPNIDLLHPNNGETHANINYDVSYVDNMALPVAMEALDVPVPVQPTPAIDPRIPNPGPRLPFGWIGAAITLPEFQTAVNNILTSGLGQYFGANNGWPQYYFGAPPNSKINPRFPEGTPLKIPSGQDVLSDSPLGDHRTSYDAPITNHYLLTSGGTTPIQVAAAGLGWSRGTTLYLLADTLSLQQNLQNQLQKDMVVTKGNIPVGTNVTVQSINQDTNGKFVFTDFDPGDGVSRKVLQVTLDTSIPDSGTMVNTWTFTRPTTDYASAALIKLWYTWANYYVTLTKDVMDQPDQSGKTIPDPRPGKENNINNVIQLDTANPNLVPGMLVKGDGLFPPGVTTILSIDSDNRTIHLSQKIALNITGKWSFFKPTMTSPAIAAFDPANLLTPFTPADSQVPGVPHVLQFAQNAYQLLSLMSQVPDENVKAVDILHNVIGGNITKPGLNGDDNHNTEVAFRDMIKSLLRGVNDFTQQTDQVNQWYPDPSVTVPNTGQNFNIYNLDPFVWLVHKKMGLSGYGFSLDDDAADISGNFSTKLGVAIGGLNGLPNHFEWSDGAPYGPVSAQAKILSAQYPEPPKTPVLTLNEIAQLPPYSFFSVKRYDVNAKVLGANLSGVGVPVNTSLLDIGNHGLYTYSYIPTDQHPPTPSDPLKGFTVNNSYLFTMSGPGTANASLTFKTGTTTQVAAPYMNTLGDVTIPSTSTLQVQAQFGLLTSYTQGNEQNARVSMVATPDSSGGQPTPKFIANAPLPSLNTVVNGTLDAARVEIVNGRLAGTGTVKGSLLVFGPVSGYDNPIEYTGWNNTANKIRGTDGGSLLPASSADTSNAKPGKLSTGDVTMYVGAKLGVIAMGATTAGTDYSQLVSSGKVNLGNSDLVLYRNINYIPKKGDTLTILTAANGITGQFRQGTSVLDTTGAFRFQITYNTNSVVLTYSPLSGSFSALSVLAGGNPLLDIIHRLTGLFAGR
jgi:hypothetical protein